MIFVPVGYTPAKKKPVAPRSRIAGTGFPAIVANAALATAAAMADTTRTLMRLKISGTLNNANTMAPAANPIWTATVIQELNARLACQMEVTWGSTAVPVNHKDMASNSATESKKRTRPEETSGRVWVSMAAGTILLVSFARTLPLA